MATAASAAADTTTTVVVVSVVHSYCHKNTKFITENLLPDIYNFDANSYKNHLFYLQIASLVAKHETLKKNNKNKLKKKMCRLLLLFSFK